MNISPTKNRVLVKETVQSNTTASGIIVQGRHGDTKTATVLAIGPTVESVVVGDVLYVDWSKAKVVMDGANMLAMFIEDDILGVQEV